MTISDSKATPLLSTPNVVLPQEISQGIEGTLMRAPRPNQQELLHAAKQYESFFISYLMKTMRETVHESGMSGKMAGYFYSFYDQEIGNRAAENGGIGISRMVQDYIEINYPPAPQVSDKESR